MTFQERPQRNMNLTPGDTQPTIRSSSRSRDAPSGGAVLALVKDTEGAP
jgi:hypothetical protein